MAALGHGGTGSATSNSSRATATSSLPIHRGWAYPTIRSSRPTSRTSGRSSHPAWTTSSVPVRTTTLTAFSYGGFVSSQFIVRHPGRQDAIVLASPGSLAKTQLPPLRAVRKQAGADLVEALRFNLGSLMIHDPAKVDDLALHVQHENTREARLRGRANHRPRPTSEHQALHRPACRAVGDLRQVSILAPSKRGCLCSGHTSRTRRSSWCRMPGTG